MMKTPPAMRIRSRPEMSWPKTVNKGATSPTINDSRNSSAMRMNIARNSPGMRGRFAKNFAGRPQGELEIHRLLYAAADHHRAVAARELRVLESRGPELRGDDLRVGHGERPRTAGLRVVSWWRQILQHDLLR